MAADCGVDRYGPIELAAFSESAIAAATVAEAEYSTIASELVAVDASQAPSAASGVMNLGTVSGMRQRTDWVGPTDTHDYYRFQVGQSSDVSLRLDGLGADVDLYLLDASGREITRSWNGGRSSELISRHLGPGTYYALVTPWMSNQSSYRFSLEVDAAGDSFGQARNLGTFAGYQQFTDWAGPADTYDFYRFQVANSSDVALRLENLQADLDLYLYDSSGREITRSWNGGTASELISRNLGAGTYYALVRPWGSAQSNYQLSLAVDAAGNSLGEARNLGTVLGSQQFNDWVGQADSHDFYRFQVTGSSDVTLRLNDLVADVDLYLYDAGGNEIARSWNGGSASEQISRTLQAGTYYALVTPWASNQSRYRFSIDVDGADSTNPFPDVPDFGAAHDWNLNAIHAPEVWAQGYTGDGVIVAVVDTGVDYYHSELAGNMWTNGGEIAGNSLDDDGNGFVDDYYGWDFADGDNAPLDQEGHGTHVAGTIAAARDGLGSTGVAYSATIMAIQVLDATGVGSFSSVAAGIRYAVDNGADIVNLSLGGGYSSEVDDALRYADQLGVLVVAAAGNDGDSMPSFPGRHAADYDSVISVGAHDASGNRASFSNYVGSSGAVQVDAPGVDVYSTLPGGQYASYQGTSMASPHVAGLAALALSANPALTPTELRSLIAHGANRSISGSDSVGGINAALTVAMAADAASAAAFAEIGSAIEQAGSYFSGSVYRAVGQAPGAGLVAAGAEVILDSRDFGSAGGVHSSGTMHLALEELPDAMSGAVASIIPRDAAFAEFENSLFGSGLRNVWS